MTSTKKRSKRKTPRRKSTRKGKRSEKGLYYDQHVAEFESLGASSVMTQSVDPLTPVAQVHALSPIAGDPHTPDTQEHVIAPITGDSDTTIVCTPLAPPLVERNSIQSIN